MHGGGGVYFAAKDLKHIPRPWPRPNWIEDDGGGGEILAGMCGEDLGGNKALYGDCLASSPFRINVGKRAAQVCRLL